jgi:hypothetical protein
MYVVLQELGTGSRWLCCVSGIVYGLTFAPYLFQALDTGSHLRHLCIRHWIRAHVCAIFVSGIGYRLTCVLCCVSGIGYGLTFAPSLVFLGHHFHKRRAFANGLGTSGAGVGSMALPNLIRFLINAYSLQGCLLISGGIIANLCVFASLYRPLRRQRHTMDVQVQTPHLEIYRNVNELEMDQLVSICPIIGQNGNDAGKVETDLLVAEESGLLETKPETLCDPISDTTTDCMLDATEHVYHEVIAVDDTRNIDADSTVQCVVHVCQNNELQNSMILLAAVSGTSLQELNTTPSGCDEYSSREECACIAGKDRLKSMLNLNVLRNPVFLVYNFGIS